MITTYSNVMAIALTIYCEAAGEDILGRELVADVIVNRAKARCLSAAEVCLEPSQFSCWNDAGVMKGVYDSRFTLPLEQWTHCLVIAEAILTGKHTTKTTATHYFNPKICWPYWADKMLVIERHGNHTFLKEKS